MAGSGAVKIKVRVSRRSVRKVDRALAKVGVNGKRATRGAITKTLNAAPKMISDFVKPLVTAKVSDLKQAVYVTKKDKGQSGLVTIRAQPLSLEKFQYSPRVPRKRPPKKGVRSTVRRKSPIYRGDAFVRPDRFGTFRIFTRERKSRYPLTKLYGPSTYTLFRYNKKNMKQIKKQLMKRFALELASQRTRFLGKYGKR